MQTVTILYTHNTYKPNNNLYPKPLYHYCTPPCCTQYPSSIPTIPKNLITITDTLNLYTNTAPAPIAHSNPPLHPQYLSPAPARAAPGASLPLAGQPRLPPPPPPPSGPGTCLLKACYPSPGLHRAPPGGRSGGVRRPWKA